MASSLDAVGEPSSYRIERLRHRLRGPEVWEEIAKMLEQHQPSVVSAQQQVMATFRSIWALVRHQEPQDASQCGLSFPPLPSSLLPAVAVSSFGHAQSCLP
jgi:hypothetical protein